MPTLLPFLSQCITKSTFRNALPGIIDPGPTKEEEQDAFELGFKSEFFGNRMRLNGAVYHVQIADMQRELNVGSELFDPVVQRKNLPD